MSSEQRLHPLSIVLNLGKALGDFLLPAVLVFFAARRAGESWEAWLAVLLIPYSALAIARYLTFRFRYGADALIVRSGVLVRRVRHIPYARIQNLDARQNPIHRLFGVVQVRIETGAGAEPEAVLDVLPITELGAMRRRVFGRETVVEPVAGAEVLLRLPPEELLLAGFIENRGMVLILALLGALWQSGIAERILAAFGADEWGEGLIRQLAAGIPDGRLNPGRFLFALSVVVAALLGLRVLSMLWSLTRLYDFRLIRDGEDLRTEYGLFTRVTATIPLRRVQSVVVREQLLHRPFGRAALRVVTAGGLGVGADARAAREWLAPILPRKDVARLVRLVLPGCEFDQVEWQPTHPRTFLRLARRWFLFAAVLAGALSPWLGTRGILLASAVLGLGLLAARARARRLGWVTAFDCVLFRDGALTSRVRIARHQRIQAVALTESPFDRRSGMAQLHADTAGSTEGFGLEMPFLPRETAQRLYRELATRAAVTAFRW